MPEGASWCGALHMLGNVAEWTSSWFDAYPGWIDPSGGNIEKNRWLAYQGEYVRVIRGGSCGDRERLVLRLPFRNFIGLERLAPPVPENHFAQHRVPLRDVPRAGPRPPRQRDGRAAQAEEDPQGRRRARPLRRHRGRPVRAARDRGGRPRPRDGQGLDDPRRPDAGDLPRPEDLAAPTRCGGHPDDDARRRAPRRRRDRRVPHRRRDREGASSTGSRR